MCVLCIFQKHSKQQHIKNTLLISSSKNIWVNYNVTNLNSSASHGDDSPDSPDINHDFQGSGEQASVMIKLTHKVVPPSDVCWFIKSQ